MGFYFECDYCTKRIPVADPEQDNPLRICEACDMNICVDCEIYGMCEACNDEERLDDE